MNNSNSTSIEQKVDAQVTDNKTEAKETQVVESTETTTTTDIVTKEKTETNTKEAISEQDKKAETTVPATEKNDIVKLNYLDIDFIFDVLSTPTASHHEYRMVTFIMLWARENKVDYEFDDYGNIYLTKGKVADGEFYPCVTSHLDTVQHAQESYAQCGVPLQLKERTNTKGGHELYVDGMGIGADDKAGVLISLSLFKYCDKLKACFFLEEEVGCCGSKKLNKAWFDNVGYVIGWDSPDRNRAAYACSSELLFGKEFFEKIKPTCEEHGVTVFNSEPFTDVKEIRQQTEVVCMNFGNGGYNAHAYNEYVVMEDIDGACGLGVALIKLLGTEKYRMPSKTIGYSTVKSSDPDVDYFASRNRSAYNYNYNYNNNTYRGSGATTTTTTTTQQTDSKKDQRILEYVVERYEKHIDILTNKMEEREAAILQELKKLCEESNMDYEKVLGVFLAHPTEDIFSTVIKF